MEALAQRLHDHAIDDALHDLLYATGEHRPVVAIMGGHAMKRSDAAYRRVARIARALASKGYLIATGGGPGAMEAGNLGAWFSRHEPVELEAAIDLLVEEVDYHEHHYLELGYRVRERFPEGGESLAIPTWFYGHEPSNQFSTHIAKYFSNSLREDGLLAIATHGVIYAPGSAGTVQEIFMDATQNHYGVFEWISPMILFGTEYWTKTRPVRPLLESLAKGKPYADLISCSDSVDEVVRFVLEHPPIRSPR
jgi:predicted Rossmann-fold nucleotide-binding protein